MSSPKAIYRAHHRIPHLGIEPGDVVIVEPSHDEMPLRILRALTHRELPLILEHLDAFTMLECDGPPPRSPKVPPRRRPEAHRWLQVVK